MLNFNFPEKCLGLVSLPHFLYNFSRKIFLDILGNIYITVVRIKQAVMP